MQLAEYARYDGLGLAELVRNKEVTAKELANLALAGVRALNPKLNAVIRTVFRKIRSAGDPNHSSTSGTIGNNRFESANDYRRI